MTRVIGTNAIVGSSDVLQTNESVPSHELGDKILTSDGREFIYVLNGGTATVAGSIYQSPAETTGAQSRIVSAAAVGAMEVTTTDTLTATVNQFAGGYVVVTGEAGTGIGETYRIKSHPAASAAVCTFTLEDPIRVALSAASQVDIVAHPCAGVIINPITPSSGVVGVAVNAITAAQYGWLCVKGSTGVLNDSNGAITVGRRVVAGRTVAGALRMEVSGTTEDMPYLGTALTGIAASEVGLVNLNIV